MSEEASTVRIGSVAFPPGQCTNPSVLQTISYLTQIGIKTVPHPSYSPDLAPCDFWLFPKLKENIRDTVVVMRQLRRLKKAVSRVIDTLTQEDFQKLLERYNMCIADSLKVTKVSCILLIKVPI